MSDYAKLQLIRLMLDDFWAGRDGCTMDELGTLVDMISTVLEFAQE